MWLKLTDDFPVRAAEAGLSDAAVRSHIDALCSIMAREKGPVLTRRDLRRFLESDDADRAVAELLAVGWWVRQDDGTVRVVENMPDQPEPEVIAKRREATADRKRRERLRRAGLDIDPETGEIVSRRDVPRDGTRDPGRGGVGRDGSGESTYGTGDEGDEAVAGDTADDRPRVPGPGSASGAQAADGTPVDLVSAAAAVDFDGADERKLWAVAAVAARNAERARQRLAEPSRTESVPGQLDLPGLPQARRLGKDTTR